MLSGAKTPTKIRHRNLLLNKYPNILRSLDSVEKIDLNSRFEYVCSDKMKVTRKLIYFILKRFIYLLFINVYYFLFKAAIQEEGGPRVQVQIHQGESAEDVLRDQVRGRVQGESAEDDRRDGRAYFPPLSLPSPIRLDAPVAPVIISLIDENKEIQMLRSKLFF